jgi:hypothetical protein
MQVCVRVVCVCVYACVHVCICVCVCAVSFVRAVCCDGTILGYHCPGRNGSKKQRARTEAEY